MKKTTSIASQERMSDAQVGEVKRVVAGVLEKKGYSKKEGQQIISRGGELSKGLGELFDRLSQDWLEAILAKERMAHRNFFGQRFPLKNFRKTLEEYGQKRIEQWRDLGLEPHYFPKVTMSQDANFPGWKMKPNGWHYQQVDGGRIMRQQRDGSLVADREAFKLEGITVLVDSRLKPQYMAGNQMFKNDNLLGSLIKKLRAEGKIAEYAYGPQSSRFGVSPTEWENSIKPGLAEFLGLRVSQVRLGRAIEFNIIPQLYPDMACHRDGETDTWIWCEEYFGIRAVRLCAGNFRFGGLGVVSYISSENQIYTAVRPLAVLGP